MSSGKIKLLKGETPALAVHFIALDTDKTWKTQVERTYSISASVFEYQFSWVNVQYDLTMWNPEEGIEQKAIPAVEHCIIIHANTPSISDIVTFVDYSDACWVFFSGGLIDDNFLSMFSIPSTRKVAISHIELDDCSLIQWILTWSETGFTEDSFLESLNALRPNSEVIDDAIFLVDTAIEQIRHLGHSDTTPHTVNARVKDILAKLAVHLESSDKERGFWMRGAFKVFNENKPVNLDQLSQIRHYLTLRGNASTFYDECQRFAHRYGGNKCIHLAVVAEMIERGRVDYVDNAKLIQLCSDTTGDMLAAIQEFLQLSLDLYLPLSAKFQALIEGMRASLVIMFESAKQAEIDVDMSEALAVLVLHHIPLVIELQRNLVNEYWMLFDWQTNDHTLSFT